MDTERVERLRWLFNAALLHPSDERAGFLLAVCPDDPDLRAEIEGLLAADDHADDGCFLDEPPVDWSRVRIETEGPEDDLVGQTIGVHVVLRRLGRGGMGDVYLGLRSASFRQYVALKVLRRGMDSRDLLQRFEMERQILASLSHPHIARLFDGGITPDGRPYFVMEYIEGEPITRYCDEQRLSIEARLRLFQTVCHAVHYAHQNLVLHRDLKPSNLLVTQEGLPKLLDFGVAKLLNPVLTNVEVPVTRTMVRMMTPEYAAPEQVRGETVTTATDVYALGVLLYELLTGQRPYRLESTSPMELERVICLQEPERPSTCVVRTEAAALDDDQKSPTQDELSAARGLTAEQLARRLRGDLDNIVLKALRKEAHLRYASAEQLGADLERYVLGLPVEARPSTLGYRVQKFVARHRGAVLGAGAFVLLLVTFSIVTALQSAQIRSQAQTVAQERDRAQVEADKARVVSAFMVDLFRQSNPYYALGDTITAHELLARGAQRIGRELSDQPVVRGDLMAVISQAYQGLGFFDEAVPMMETALEAYRQAHGDVHPDVARTLASLGHVLRIRGDIDSSVVVLQRALDLQRRLLPEEDPVVVETMSELAAALRYQGGLEKPGAYREAEALLREALERESAREVVHPPRRAAILEHLAYVLQDQDRAAEAEALHRETLRIRRSWYGPVHLDVANSLINVAATLGRQGNYAEGEALFRKGLAMRRTIQGADHPDVAIDQVGLGELLHARGDLAAAASAYREGLARLRRVFPEGSLRTRKAIRLLGDVLMDQGRPAEAEPLFRELLTLEQQRDDNRVWIAVMQHRLGACLVAMGRYNEAEALLIAGFQTLHETLGPSHEDTQATLGHLIDLYEARGRPDAAASYRALLIPETQAE